MAEKPTELHLVWLLRDARDQAEYVVVQLGELRESLGKREFVRALGAFDALQERMLFVGKALQIVAREQAWADENGRIRLPKKL